MSTHAVGSGGRWITQLSPVGNQPTQTHYLEGGQVMPLSWGLDGTDRKGFLL